MKYPTKAGVTSLLFLWSFSYAVLGFRSVSPHQSSRTVVTKRNKQRLLPEGSSATRAVAVTSTGLQMGLIGALRGGAVAEVATSALTTSFQGDATFRGILALTAVASAAVTPLTLYRQVYSFSVGYGLSVSAMGLALLKVFWDSLSATNGGAPSYAPLLLVSSLVFYGIRLGTFLLVREITVPSKRDQVKSFDKTPLLKRIPFSFAVSLLYAFMVTPALFLCRASAMGVLSDKAGQITMVGAGLAWIGAVIEGISDQQKFMAKRGKDGSTDFEGPTTGWYGLSRHPNYVGEIIFWFGILVGGAPGLQKNIPAWIASLLGFVSIYQIMIGATGRLEKKQGEKYDGQSAYENWKKKVPKLFPTNVLGSILPVSVSVGLTAALMKAVLWLVATAPAV